jgi:hypothetical protein
MNRSKGVFFAKLACITIISLSGCNTDQTKVALETTSSEKGQAAVAKLTDQALLAKVASEAKDYGVRLEAIQRLTDQTLLTKIALEHQDSYLRASAIKKLTDQTLLAKIAVEDKGPTIRCAAIKELTDYVLLAKIAMGDPDQWNRETAIQKLMDTVMFAKIASERKDSRVQLIYKLICEFDTVPPEHRIRLICNILPAIRVLFDLEAVNEVGEIVSVETAWKNRYQDYHGNTGFTGQMLGEYFNCSIKLKNVDLHLSNSWETDFPVVAQTIAFKAADVNASDLLNPIFEQISQVSLAKIAVEDVDPNISRAAIEKLTDPGLLVKIAKEQEDRSIYARFRLHSLLKIDGATLNLDSIARVYCK